MERKKISIGLFGFGCVGKGLYDVIGQTPGLQAEIRKIAVKDRNKKRVLPADYFTFDKWELLDDPKINIIVELIDDAEEAYLIVKEALLRGKSVVTANKKMLANHLEELIEIQQKTGTSLVYEAAACASIPVIRNLEEYYDTDLLRSLQGIVNGSTNYILSKIFRDRLDFQSALTLAQEKGFAESDPRLDIEGYDANFKLCLLLAHAFGLVVEPGTLFFRGIDKIADVDARYAREKGWKIKLVAHAQKIGDKVHAFVLPQFIAPEHPFYHVDEEYNSVQVEGCFADKQCFIGKGAGSHPTASAVLSDISALSYGYRYEYKKRLQSEGLELSQEVVLEVFVSYPPTVQIADADFLTIEERYQSGNEYYLRGNIRLDVLQQTKWIEEKEVSLILGESWKASDFSEEANLLERVEEELLQ